MTYLGVGNLPELGEVRRDRDFDPEGGLGVFDPLHVYGSIYLGSVVRTRPLWGPCSPSCLGCLLPPSVLTCHRLCPLPVQTTHPETPSRTRDSYQRGKVIGTGRGLRTRDGRQRWRSHGAYTGSRPELGVQTMNGTPSYME